MEAEEEEGETPYCATSLRWKTSQSKSRRLKRREQPNSGLEDGSNSMLQRPAVDDAADSHGCDNRREIPSVEDSVLHRAKDLDSCCAQRPEEPCCVGSDRTQSHSWNLSDSVSGRFRPEAFLRLEKSAESDLVEDTAGRKRAGSKRRVAVVDRACPLLRC